MAAKNPRKKLNLHDLLKEHPLILLIGVAVAVGGIVFSVSSYFYNEEIKLTEKKNEISLFQITKQNDLTVSQLTKEKEMRIAKFENELSSINRSLAGGDFLNVSKFVIKPSTVPGISTSTTFFNEDRLYAARLPDWKYSKQSQEGILKSIEGDEAILPVGISPRLAHVWQRGDLLNVENSSPFKHIAPLIMVLRLTHEELTEALQLPENVPWSPEAAKKFKVDSVFRGDLVGSFLAQMLAYVYTLRFTTSADVELSTVQKVSNVLYSQVRITLRDVKINAKSLPAYFITVESTVISTNDNVYFIVDVMPSEEPVPRGEVSAELTLWLNQFAILGH